MKMLLAGLILLVTFPAVVGSAAVTIATAPHPAPASPLFAFVPPGGFQDAYPFGQCTWWAAYNRRVTWGGNAADWIRNAESQGVATNDRPSVGAIAVWGPGRGYDPLYGHVAIVTTVTPGSYTVSEMNVIGWGRVSTRVVTWPDRSVEGFIPLRDEVKS